MRRVISFCVAAALVLSGFYLLVDGAVDVSGHLQDIPIRGAALFLSACASLICIGAWWLWTDFIAPAFGYRVDD